MLNFALAIPAFLDASRELLTALATTAAVTSISLAVDIASPNQLHEKQLKTCLKRSFEQSKKLFDWPNEGDVAFSTFESTLISFTDSFNQETLKVFLETAVGAKLNNNEVNVWVDKLIKQITLKEHDELFKYFVLNSIIVNSSKQKAADSHLRSSVNYNLTPSASIYDNPEIINRDVFVDEILHDLSSGKHLIQITGMGGLGKTEALNKLFAKLANNKHLANFDHIAFIRFSGDILSDIESQVDYQNPSLILQGIEDGMRYLYDLCTNHNVLLCIDDTRVNQEILKLDHPCVQYFRSLRTSIVLASRVGFTDFLRRNLEFLPTEACVEIFERKYEKPVSSSRDIATLNSIIENRAGNHTLIINRLGNMARDYRWTISMLSERLMKKEFNFQKSIADDELLQQEISKLYLFSDELTTAEKNILEAFSIFPVAPLAGDLCVKWLHEDAGLDPDSCVLQLNRLTEKTWLVRRIDAEDSISFYMHQLVQTAVKTQNKTQISAHPKLVKNCAASLSKAGNPYFFLNSSTIIPFAISIFNGLFQEKPALVKLSSAIAVYYYKSSDFSTSLDWYMKALEMEENILVKDPMVIASIYNDIAFVYHKQEKYDLAHSWYKKSLDIKEPTLGKDHPSTILTYNNLASVYKDQREYNLALDSYLNALEGKEKIFGVDNPDTAVIYLNIADVCSKLKRNNQAISWYIKAFIVFERYLGLDHPYTNLAREAITYLKEMA